MKRGPEYADVLGTHARVARSFRDRARGLLGERSLPPGEGLLIERCSAIHTCFMKFTIDAAFLDRDNRPVKIVRGIRPGRLCVFGGFKAVKVLETQSRPQNGDGFRV